MTDQLILEWIKETCDAYSIPKPFAIVEALEAARATAEQSDELQAYSDWATDTRYSNSLECWQAACAWQRKAEARSDIPPVGYVTQDDLQRLHEGMGAIVSPGNGVADIPLYVSQQDAAIESKPTYEDGYRDSWSEACPNCGHVKGEQLDSGEAK